MSNDGKAITYHPAHDYSNGENRWSTKKRNSSSSPITPKAVVSDLGELSQALKRNLGRLKNMLRERGISPDSQMKLTKEDEVFLETAFGILAENRFEDLNLTKAEQTRLIRLAPAIPDRFLKSELQIFKAGVLASIIGNLERILPKPVAGSEPSSTSSFDPFGTAEVRKQTENLNPRKLARPDSNLSRTPAEWDRIRAAKQKLVTDLVTHLDKLGFNTSNPRGLQIGYRACGELLERLSMIPSSELEHLPLARKERLMSEAHLIVRYLEQGADGLKLEQMGRLCANLKQIANEVAALPGRVRQESPASQISGLNLKLELDSWRHDRQTLESFLANPDQRTAAQQLALLSQRMKTGHEEFFEDLGTKQPQLTQNQRNKLMKALAEEDLLLSDFSQTIARNCDALLQAALVASPALDTEQFLTVLMGIKAALDKAAPQK